MTSRLWPAALLIAGITLGTACSDELTGPRSELRDARTVWQGADLASYQYVYHVLCFCAIVEPVRIFVVDDSVTAAFLVEGNVPLSDEQTGWMPTVNDLFDRLEDVLLQDPVEYSAEFDSGLGFPVRASVDVSRQIADEEFSFTAYDLVPTAEVP